VRISINSAREDYYLKYYKPRGYTFRDVLRSITIAKKKKAFVSINYLTMPGFADRQDESEAFRKLVSRHKVDMVQWRNLNYDPLHYFNEMGIDGGTEKLIGVKNVIDRLKRELPSLRMGYFNPFIPREAASPRR